MPPVWSVIAAVWLELKVKANSRSSGPVFAGGVGLWAASLALVSAPSVMPSWLRVVAAVAALLFGVVAVKSSWDVR